VDANKWNYYRILQVQPDAPHEVIRHNYTILLQKLRIHPDLGGNDRDAALINVAYETLRHPQKRLEYDQQLLRQNSLLTVAQRHLTGSALFSIKPKGSSAPTKEKNQRNYYRILQVHPDAHETVIRERYMALLNTSDLPRDLLNEAYFVLNNPQKRVEYDRLLKRYKHAVAVKKMQAETDELNKDIRHRSDSFASSKIYSRNEFDYYSGCCLQTFPDLSGREITSMNYSPLITRYCEFCKTPHSFDSKTNDKTLCLICDSPLFSPGKEILGKSIRCLERIKRSESIIFYVYWPGQKLPGRLFDISPKGLRFNTEFGLDTGQIIKIEGEKFKAVAEVVHSQVEDNRSSIGVCFRTVLFHSAKGSFLLTSV
jgi:curved DNA-binding protein CbpA